MNNFQLTWGKVEEKETVLPHKKNEVVVLHTEKREFPTGYAMRSPYFKAYILTEMVFPQYQHP